MSHGLDVLLLASIGQTAPEVNTTASQAVPTAQPQVGEALSLTEFKDVVIYGNRIASVQPANSPSTDGEVTIDGNGGTLIPGMYEMHGHLGQGNALLNIAAGVTSVRDMGNENDVLESLIGRINSGEIAGPRITRSCFIEGESDFSAATGETVATLEEALDMVRWCGARDFYQVKFYNSMRGEWAEQLVDEAHSLDSDFDSVLYVFTGVPDILPFQTAVAANDNDTRARAR